jgi:hypothetical protein
MEKHEFILELLAELSYRSDEGYPILSKQSHIYLISEILDEWGFTDIKNELIQNLTEEEKTFKSPALNKKVEYTDNDGNKKSGLAGNLLRLAKDQPGRIAAEAGLPAEGTPERDKLNNELGGEGQPDRDINQNNKEKVGNEDGVSTPTANIFSKDSNYTAPDLDKTDTNSKPKPKPKFPKKALNNKWKGKSTAEIINSVSTSNDPEVIPTMGSDDVSKRAFESQQLAFGGKAGKGGGDTTIQEEMTNIGRALIFTNPNISKAELAEKISENVKQNFTDSEVAQNIIKLKKLSKASVAGFGSAKKIQSNPKFKYNKNQPTGYPVNTTDSILVRDALSTQLIAAEKTGNQDDIDHSKNELYEFQKNAADKSITGKEGDADTMVIYKDTDGRDRVCYISNKQSLSDPQSSGTINSSKKALTFASNRLGLSDTEKQDVLTIAEEQFQKANQFDETFAKGVKTAVEANKERLSTPQAQTTMAKAAQALTGRSKIGKPNNKLTPSEKKKKESYITDSLKKPEVQAHLLGLEGAPNDDVSSSEYKKWKKNTIDQFKINGGEYSNQQITHSATLVTGTGGILRGNHLRTNEKIAIVSRDIYEKMKKLIDDGVSKEEASAELKTEFDKPNKKGEVMYGGVFDESDLIELYDNAGLRDIENAERQRGIDIKEMQTETVSRLIEKDNEAGHNPPPVNGKRTQAYVAGYFDRVHITQNVGGTADGRKLTEMGEYSVSPADYRNALAVSTDFPTEDVWLMDNPNENYNIALEEHLIGNVTVEGVDQELHYISTDGKKRHIGTDTHRTGGQISKVAGSYGKDLQKELARQSEESSNT